MKNILAILSFFRKHQLILLTISFFLIWKLLLVSLLWQERSSPPEPDDSYSYISTIASASACHASLFCSQYKNTLTSDYSSYIQLSYRVIFGGIAKLFSLSPEATYQASFYIGTILMAGAVLVFVQSFTRNSTLISLGVLSLTLYHGSGEIHGFFWVVPSFFSTLFFFLIAAFIVRDTPTRWPYWATPLTVPIFIFMHPASVYFLAIFPIYIFFQFLLERKIPREALKKTVTIIFIGLVSITMQSILMTKNGQGDPYGIQSIFPQALTSFSHMQLGADNLVSYDITTNQPGLASEIDQTSYFANRMRTLNITYFRWFFPHWIVVFPFLCLLMLLYRNKQFKIISFYIASLLFFVISTLANQFGFRSAIILWPITYLLLIFGYYYLILSLPQGRPIIYRIGFGIATAGLVFFIILNMLYALTVNTNINIRNNYVIDKNFENHLLDSTAPGETLYMPRLVRQSIFGSTLFSRNRLLPPEQHPTVVIVLQSNHYQSTVINASLRRFINSMLSFFGKSPLSKISSAPKKTLPEFYSLEKSFGDILIYRNTTPSTQ